MENADLLMSRNSKLRPNNLLFHSDMAFFPVHSRAVSACIQCIIDDQCLESTSEHKKQRRSTVF